MPTNGFADGILYSVNGAPIFTYGMITVTAIVLAYVTFIEVPDIPEISNPLETPETTSISQVIPPAGMVYPIPNSPEMPSPLSISENEPVKEESPVEAEPVEASPVEAEPVEESPVEAEPVPKEKLPQGGKKKKTRHQTPKPKKRKTIKYY